MAIDPVTLGTRIAQLRVARNMSLGSLSVASGGLAKSYLSRLEQGKVANPGVQTLDQVASALGSSLLDLLMPLRVQRTDGPKTSSGRKMKDGSEFAEDMPEALRVFAEEMRSTRRTIPRDTIRSLAALQYRGRQPKTAEDWRFLFDALVRSVGKAR